MAEPQDLSSPANEPVVDHSGVDRTHKGPAAGIALCLSGGGYRAMLFHVGAIVRIKQLGLLSQISWISSVSGGSITAGVLGMNWGKLNVNSPDVSDLLEHLVKPIRVIAGETIDTAAVGWGTFNPLKTIGDEVASYYRKYLFKNKTLQDLPESPRFMINSTNVMTGSLWRFSRKYMGDYQVGLIEEPTTELAVAVAASSAFPPFLSPMRVKLSPDWFKAETLGTLGVEPYTKEAVLTDGGVYDNLGLETAWKRFDTILVSDGGRKMSPDPKPAGDWAMHSRRLIDLLQHQTSNLRRKQVMDSYKRFTAEGAPSLAKDGRKGTYWGIQTDIKKYELADSMDCPFETTTTIANIDTRLAAMSEAEQNHIMNWGYAVCDAALRKNMTVATPPPPAFPFANGIGS